MLAERLSSGVENILFRLLPGCRVNILASRVVWWVAANMTFKGFATSLKSCRPLHLQPVFAHLGYSVGDFPVSEDCASRVLCLPMHGYMGEGEVERVVEAIDG